LKGSWGWEEKKVFFSLNKSSPLRAIHTTHDLKRKAQVKQDLMWKVESPERMRCQEGGQRKKRREDRRREIRRKSEFHVKSFIILFI
jgi:hypothetical protein